MPRLHALVLVSALTPVAALLGSAAQADVTIQEQSTFDVSVIKMHGTSTEYTTADKQRRDSEQHCEGFMSMFCGNVDSGHITRLDKGVEWSLEPKKKEYRETSIPTPEQRKAVMDAAAAEMEKMKSCPVSKQEPSQPAPDTSKCEMTPPKFEVKKPGTHATIAGHDSQLTQLAMTQSCVNKQTGDSCDFVLMFDSWLTQDEISGLEERRTFATNYAAKLGLTPGSPTSQAQMAQMQRFLAPYADAMKEVSAKAGDFKGFPLKTQLRIAFGGPSCAAAKNAQNSAGSGGSNGSAVGDAGQAGASAGASATAGAAGAGASTAASAAAGGGIGGSILGSAAGAFGSKLVGGMFAKKQASSTPAPSTTPSTDSTLAPGLIQAASITMETTAINPGAIPTSQFDIPAGWKLDVPRPTKEHEFTCPKS